MATERNDALRKKHRAMIARSKPACHICGQPIDYTLRYPEPMCFVVDHVVPLKRGGPDTLANKRAAHHACNSKKRAREYAPIVRKTPGINR